jgi:radical SAM-linked protein
VNFGRPEETCYIGHIDLTRAITRGLRRSELPLQFTEGFNERVKLEMGFPLSVGMLGEDEYFDFYLSQRKSEEEIFSALDEAFKNIIHIKRIKEVAFNAPSITSFDAILVHFLYGRAESTETEHHIEEILNAILGEEKIVVKRKSKGKIKEKDVREFINELKLLKLDKNSEMILLASVYFTKRGSIKMEELEHIIQRYGVNVKFSYVIRKKTLIVQGNRIISPWEV